jgi:hypothetical protein
MPRQLLCNLRRAFRETAVGVNTREPVWLNKIDEAKVLDQFPLGNLTCIEVGPRNSRYARRRTAGLQKTAFGIGAGVQVAIRAG